jgi:hypothetical protein
MEPPTEPPISAFRKLYNLAEEFLGDWFGIGALWRFVKREWRGVKEGRVLIVVIAVVSVLIGFWARGLLISPEKGTSRIVQQPYRQYDEREWPPLTNEQIAEWVKALAPFHLHPIRVIWGQEVEARRLFRTLQEIGGQLKCDVTAIGGYADKPEISVAINKGDPAGPVLQRLFQEYQKGGPSVAVTLEGIEDATEITIALPECPQRQEAQTPRPVETKQEQSLPRNYPWLSMELIFNASGTTIEDGKTKITKLDLKMPYHNRGGSILFKMHSLIEIMGQPQTLDGPDSLAPGEQGYFSFDYDNEEVSSAVHDTFVSGKFPIKCDVTFRDIAGVEFGVVYEWTGRGFGKEPSLPKVTLKGEYLKFKQP